MRYMYRLLRVNASYTPSMKQEAQLPQWDRAMHYVSKFVLCFTSYESNKGFKQQK